MVQIDDASAGKLPAQFSRENSHVAGQNHIVDVLLIDHFFKDRVIRIAL